jgi:lipoate-protein ligase A
MTPRPHSPPDREAAVCRVFPHHVTDGPHNMARDEALLELVASDPGAAAFRTYGWAVPTLSLGYFQAIAQAEADPRWRNVPLVRRPTGGGAIWHDREITYALAIPRSHPLARQSGDLYRVVHEAIAELLRDLGVVARRRDAERTGQAGAPRPFLCFLDRDPEDLIVGPAKVVGSAQRRRSGTILQHGSVLLSRSSRTPELPGVGDLAASPAEAPPWAVWLEHKIPLSLGCRPEPVTWDGPTLDRAEELASSIYSSPAWTHRR